MSGNKKERETYKNCHNNCVFAYFDGLFRTYCKHPMVQKFICDSDSKCSVTNCEYYKENKK